MQFIASHTSRFICILILSHYVPKCAFCSGHLTETLQEFVFSPIHATRLANLTPVDLITKIITGGIKIFEDPQYAFLFILHFVFYTYFF